jgi:hypothetical protein
VFNQLPHLIKNKLQKYTKAARTRGKDVSKLQKIEICSVEEWVKDEQAAMLLYKIARKQPILWYKLRPIDFLMYFRIFVQPKFPDKLPSQITVKELDIEFSGLIHGINQWCLLDVGVKSPKEFLKFAELNLIC